MKVGTPIKVYIGDGKGGVHEVAEAYIIESDYDQVTIEIPGTQVIMAVSHSLSDETPAPEVDRVLSDTVERVTRAEPDDSAVVVRPQVTESGFANASPEPQSLRSADLDSSVLD